MGGGHVSENLKGKKNIREKKKKAGDGVGTICHWSRRRNSKVHKEDKTRRVPLDREDKYEREEFKTP